MHVTKNFGIRDPRPEPIAILENIRHNGPMVQVNMFSTLHTCKWCHVENFN